MDLKELITAFKQKLSKNGDEKEGVKDESEENKDATTDVKGKKKPLIDFGEEYFWTSCFAVAVIAALLFGYLLKNNYFEFQALTHLENQSENLAASIEQSTQDVNQLASAIIALNPNAENIVELIESSVDNTLRVIKVEEPIDTIEPTPEFPGINFATYDMLKQTSEKQEEQLPEIHLYGQSNQYLNYVYIQKPDETYVVVSYPVELIIKPQKMQFVDSELALVQKSGPYSSVVLQKWGMWTPIPQEKTKKSVFQTPTFMSLMP